MLNFCIVPPVGLLNTLRNPESIATASAPELLAAVEPSPLQPATWPLGLSEYVSRAEAMTVPAYARAQGIICGTVGTLPLTRWAKGNRRLDPIPLQYQPDPASPKSVTYSWLADSIWNYGYGFLLVLDVYSEDGRPSRMRWIDPLRVTAQTNSNGTLVTGWLLDGEKTPQSGIGSLIYFQGLNEGILVRAGRTLRTAIELEEAAARNAKEPAPQIVLKNKGVNIPKDKVTETLDKWKEFRRTRATGFLNADLDIETVGYTASEQQLVDARKFHTSEIARLTGIPAWYLNAEAASMTYTNVTSERRALIDFSIRPILYCIQERLSMPDVLARDLNLRFDLDDFLKGNPVEQVDVISKMLEAGIISIDEAREQMDLAPRGNPA